MSVSAKCKFANLKYEQLLSEKYFVQTCFSKKYESYTAKEKLADMWMDLITEHKVESPVIETPFVEILCIPTTTTTTTTTTSTTTTTTTVV